MSEDDDPSCRRSSITRGCSESTAFVGSASVSSSCEWYDGGKKVPKHVALQIPQDAQVIDT